MPLSSFVGVAVGVAVVSIGLYHVVFVGPRLREMVHRPHDNGLLADAGSRACRDVGKASSLHKPEERLATLERAVKKELYRLGFVRFNAFTDVGSDLSFALALLNEEGDGVLVTSIYAREETRTFGKVVHHFVPQQGASKEEQTAISLARVGAGAGVA